MIIEIAQQCINISESKLMHWPKGGWENTNSHESGRDTKSQGKCHPTRHHTLEEGGRMKGDQRLVRGPLGKKPQNRKYPLNQGKLDQRTHILWGAWLQGVGEELHHQVGDIPQTMEGMMNQMKRKMRRMILMKKLCQ